MKVLVLGSGIIGITSAWYLAKAGHEVTVVDRQSGCALETSFGNAGMISPGYSSPWAAPGVPIKALKWMFTKHAPLAIRPTANIFQYHWMLKMLANCTEARYAVNKKRMMELAEFSRDCLIDLRRETSIDYEHQELGTLQLFRSQKQLDAIANDIAVLEQCNVPFQLLDREGCVQYEPGLAPSADKIVGGLRLPNDETGDCYLFTSKLAAKCAELGVKFRYKCEIKELLREGNEITGVRIGEEILKADKYVLALGSYSPKMLRTHGINLPVYPVKGYSLTIPISNPEMAPSSTVMDETYKVAITRFDERIRVGGMAELTGFDQTLKEKHKNTLAMVVSDLFPQGGDAMQGDLWTGFRPMTPDGTPIIGATSVSNLYLNTGHGTLGWTMSCGSGQFLADLISDKIPAISSEGYSINRYTSKKEGNQIAHSAPTH